MKIYKQKINLIFLTIICTFIIALSIILILFLNISDLDYLLILLTIVLVITTIILLILKKRLDLNLFYYKHSLLFTNLEPTIKTTINLNSPSFTNKLLNEGYLLYNDYNDYKIYYYLKNENKKDERLFFFIIINSELSFESNKINKNINQLEDDIFKKKKIRKRIIFQLKFDDKFTQNNAQKTNNILFVQNKFNFITLINIYYFTQEKTFYFIHSKKYPPNLEYDFATKYLLDLLSINK